MKGQFDHSYTFWTMPILIFSLGANFKLHPLCSYIRNNAFILIYIWKYLFFLIRIENLGKLTAFKVGVNIGRIENWNSSEFNFLGEKMELPLLKLVARALKVWHSSSTFSRAFQNCKNHQNPTTIDRLAKPAKIPEPRPVVRTTRSIATRSGTIKKRRF